MRNRILKIYLQTTVTHCTVGITIAWWAFRITVVIIAGVFDIHPWSVIFPASGTAAGAFHPQHQHHVGEASCNNHGDV